MSSYQNHSFGICNVVVWSGGTSIVNNGLDALDIDALALSDVKAIVILDRFV